MNILAIGFFVDQGSGSTFTLSRELDITHATCKREITEIDKQDIKDLLLEESHSTVEDIDTILVVAVRAATNKLKYEDLLWNLAPEVIAHYSGEDFAEDDE